MSGIDQITRAKVLARDSFTCTYCGRGVSWHSSEVDHVEPRSQGGADDIENFVTSCVRCNQRKSGRTPDEWFGSPEERAWTAFAAAAYTSVAITDAGEGWADHLSAERAAKDADALLAQWRKRWAKR